MILNPLESGHITALTYQTYALQMPQIVLVDILSLGVLLSDRPYSRWTCIEMIDYVKADILLSLSMSYQKTSGLGVPTGLPSKMTDLTPDKIGP